MLSLARLVRELSILLKSKPCLVRADSENCRLFFSYLLCSSIGFIKVMLMNCAWEAYLNILPSRLRPLVDKSSETLQDIRLRLNEHPILCTQLGRTTLDTVITPQDLQYCINAASSYSPWTAKTIADGFITARGGHRIGICGDAVVSGGKMEGIRAATSLAIRVARDYVGIAAGLEKIAGSVLIIGSPGTGKTTLLRDLIRRRSSLPGICVSVVDERQEIFPLLRQGDLFHPGDNTDILTGCPKPQGVIQVLRNMGPSVIAVDEITSKQDCQALTEAAWCGVDLVATAHARNAKEFYASVVYKPLIQCGIFQTLVVLRSDKTWYTERIPHEY